jgi:hypothetical protein
VAYLDSSLLSLDRETAQFLSRRRYSQAEAVPKKTAAGKQPYAVALADRGLMALAGGWENWRSPAREWVRSFAIITTTPNELCAELHDRMPVVLKPGAWPAWLGEEPADPPQLKALLAPYPAEDMTCWPVSARVGNVRNNDASLTSRSRVPGRRARGEGSNERIRMARRAVLHLGALRMRPGWRRSRDKYRPRPIRVKRAIAAAACSDQTYSQGSATGGGDGGSGGDM